MIIPRKILIVRTDRIGDTMLTLPMVALIKNYYPNAEVSFLVNVYTYPLLQNYPLLNKVLKTDDSGKIDSHIFQQIESERFDTTIIVFPRFNIAKSLFRSNIKNLIGTSTKWYSFLFNNKVQLHRKKSGLHETDLNFKLLEPLGINVPDKIINYPNLIITAEMKDKINSLLKNYNIEKFIVVHPGSGGSSLDLPLDKYKDLIKLLVKNNSTKVLITGSEKEKEMGNYLSDSKDIIDFTGKFNLSEFSALLSLSKIVISNSTGPLHIAAALGIFVVGFYPRIKEISKTRWAPYTEKKMIFEPENDCENCSMDECIKKDCMRTININNAAEFILHLLKENE